MADGNATRKRRGRERRRCEVCSASFTTPASKTKRTCGTVCGKALAARITREKGNTPLGYCKGCHAEMWLTMCGGERRRYCSRACSDDHSKRITAEVRALQRIGVAVRASEASHRRTAREARLRAETEARYMPRACIRCGCTVASAQEFGKPRDVCDPCREAKNAEVKRIAKHMRRARVRGSTTQRIDPIRVFEQAGWQCNYCKRATPQSLRGTLDPLAPELDHFIPLAMGGTHTRDNVVCSCRECNQEKGSQSPGEFLVAKGLAISFPLNLSIRDMLRL